LRIRRLIACCVGMTTLCMLGGCGIAPKSFRAIRHPAPLVRARSVGLSERLPDSQAIPALVERLNDPDPVVRLTANQELKRRTGQDFGFIPWEDPQARAGAVSRWKAWMADRFGVDPRRNVARRGPRTASPQSTPAMTRVTLPSPPALPSEQR
jgi:hypothetical protein